MGKSLFAQAIKRYRESVDIGLSDLVEQLTKVGSPIDVSTLSRYESGERRPSASFIAYFSRALELTPKDKEHLLNMYIEDDRLTALKDFTDMELKLRAKTVKEVK